MSQAEKKERTEKIEKIEKIETRENMKKMKMPKKFITTQNESKIQCSPVLFPPFSFLFSFHL